MIKEFLDRYNNKALSELDFKEFVKMFRSFYDTKFFVKENKPGYFVNDKFISIEFLALIHNDLIVQNNFFKRNIRKFKNRIRRFINE